jgi:hypothetical protein
MFVSEVEFEIREEGAGLSGPGTRLAERLDALILESLRDVYDHASGTAEEARASADRAWDEVAAGTGLPVSVTAEVWLAVLNLALSEETALGSLCRAATLARHRGVPWPEFARSVRALKAEGCAAGADPGG